MGNVEIKINSLEVKIGEEVILSNINFEMKNSRIYGLVGRNGSGKSILLKCIVGLLKPTTGEIIINGKTIGKDINFYDKIGFIINEPGFMEDKSGFKNLKYLASIKKSASVDDIRNAMGLVGLDYNSKKKYGEYSLGMKQKLGIAQAIMENPEILILDEPMNALDDVTIEIVRKLLLDLKKQGKLIIITSHNHEDIDFLCDEVINIKEGHIVKIYKNNFK